MLRQKPRLARVSWLVAAFSAACGDDAPTAPTVTSEALSVLAAQVDQWVSQGATVGAELLVIQRGELLLNHAAGWKDRELQIPMETGTMFSIASMTKPILTTAVLMLVDEGALNLTDRASQFLPSFDNDRSREITIQQLLTRTAGFTQPGYPQSLTAYTSLREAVAAAGAEGPAATPGTIFARTQAGSGTLGALVEEISGMPVEEFMQTWIFEPLGMTENTLTDLPLDHPQRPLVSSIYSRETDGSFIRVWGKEDPPSLSFFPASSGVITTVIEYAKFLTMWLNGGRVGSEQFVSPELVERALVIEPLSIGGFVPYGFHWEVDIDPAAPVPSGGILPRSLGHRGSTGTIGWIVPEEELIVIYFTQSAGGTTHHEMPFVVRDVLSR